MPEGLRLSEYGGAKVFRTCTVGGIVRNRGCSDLTAEEVNAIPRPNLHALINGNYLQPYPPAPSLSTPKGERFIVRRTDLRYDIVQGVRVNDEPLATKAEAEAFMEGPSP